MGNIFFKTKKENLFNIPKTFWELKAKNIDGEEVNFETLKGKKAFIVVNVASSCGLANSNYKGLNELYNKYRYTAILSFFLPFTGKEA